MRLQNTYLFKITLTVLLMTMVIPSYSFYNYSDEDILPDTINVVQFKGKIIDEDTGDALMFATVGVENTNIATVSNSEGEFLIKVPKELDLSTKVMFSYLGYEDKAVMLSELSEKRNKVRMKLVSVSLAEINVVPKDAHQIIREMLYYKKDNYVQEPLQMTAFYRETIQKRRTYVSLSEAVVDVYKQPYDNYRRDDLKLYKARKDADYSKMDTLSFKLQGGPYSTLMLDIMKDPYAILSYEDLEYYDFKIDNITKIKDKIIFVVHFEQKPYVETPMFYGKLFIEAESLALTSAKYSINLSNREEASAMFIKEKPAGAVVYPSEASYMVNYKKQNGKWIYSYSRGSITFKINWKKKVFNTSYTSNIEMAITDWKKATVKPFKAKEQIKRNIILQDRIEGFGDPEFWGSYNVIEPEASIESVIKKIKKRLDKRAKDK